MVHWIVTRNFMNVSSSQLEAFRALNNNLGENIEDNFRPPQPLNGRVVSYATINWFKLLNDKRLTKKFKPIQDVQYLICKKIKWIWIEGNEGKVFGCDVTASLQVMDLFDQLAQIIFNYIKYHTRSIVKSTFYKWQNRLFKIHLLRIVTLVQNYCNHN